MPSQTTPSPQHTPVQYLLPEAKAQDSDKICVVIDLDETLVHSSFKVGPAQQFSATDPRGGLPWPGREVSAGFPPWGPLSISCSHPSSSQPVNNADFIIPVEIDGVVHQVRGRGRWGVGVCTTPRYLPPVLREPHMEH